MRVPFTIIVLSLFLPISLNAQTIQRATSDSALITLTIQGQNLGTNRPMVTLGGTSLVVTSFSSTKVVATLPAGIAPASYLLVFTRASGDTTSFVATIGAVGPQGPQGAGGPPGPQGPAGPRGATGATGPVGSPGPTGATGAQGPQGVTGTAGPSGPTGPPGAAGSPGAKGDSGNSVHASPLGQSDTRCVGAGGYEVFEHETVTGLDISVGLICNGVAGAQGLRGAQGETGQQGLPGPQGDIGPVGPQGPAGPQGASGASATLPVCAVDGVLVSRGGGLWACRGLCGGSLVDTSSDGANCGGCGQNCGVCVDHPCQCLEGQCEVPAAPSLHLVAANTLSSDTVRLDFDDCLAPASIAPGQFTIAGAAVFGATPSGPATIILTVSTLTRGVRYTLTVGNILNCAVTASAAGSTADFVASY